MTKGPSENSKVYRSKRDPLLVLSIWAGSALLLLSCVDIYHSPLGPLVKTGIISVSVAACSFCMWLLYATTYRFGDGKLLARSGPFRYAVPLIGIEVVKPSRNSLDGPACSFDRLHVLHRGSRYGLMVSPLDRAGFIEELKANCPHLKTDGDTLIRK